MSERSRHALLIASHKFEDPKFQQLRSPARDTDELAQVLAAPQTGDFDVRKRVNYPVAEVLQELEDFFTERSPEDLLLLYFSCHGVKDPSGQLHFAMANTKYRRLRSTSIAASFIKEQMEATRSRRVVLILDCCFSGAFLKGWTARADDSVDVKEQMEGRGRAIITASKSTEYAFEASELTSATATPSIFTGAMIHGLRTGEADMDGDGRVSVDELYNYVYDKVKAEVGSQTPGKWTNVEGDLIIARNPNPKPPPPEFPDRAEDEARGQGGEPGGGGAEEQAAEPAGVAGSSLRWWHAGAALGAAAIVLLVLVVVATGGDGRGDKIVFQNLQGGGIAKINADGSGLVTLSREGAAPAPSHDGKRIAFEREFDDKRDIYVMDADGSDVRRLTTGSGDNFDPSWSPDNRRIVFESDRDGNSEIYLMAADGNGQTRLTGHAAKDSDPTFSPDGRFIAFDSDRDGTSEIYRMTDSGADVTRLTEHAEALTDAVWSPDGTRIAVEAEIAGNFEICVMAADGTRLRQLTRDPASDFSPNWSPDGKLLIFTRSTATSRGLYVMNADGSGQRLLAELPAGDPDWGAA